MPLPVCMRVVTTPMRVPQDPDQAALALLDLSRRRPAAAAAHAAAATERCECAGIDEEHFRARPGLRVLQMAWHPGKIATPQIDAVSACHNEQQAIAGEEFMLDV